MSADFKMNGKRPNPFARRRCRIVIIQTSARRIPAIQGVLRCLVRRRVWRKFNLPVSHRRKTDKNEKSQMRLGFSVIFSFFVRKVIDIELLKCYNANIPILKED